MFRINSKFCVGKSASISEKKFMNEQMNPSAKGTFNCCKCRTENSFSITPYETGFPFSELYKNNFLSEIEITKNRIATKTSNWLGHLGEYTVNDLPTLYFGISCENCKTSHLLVFGCGEKQPDLFICEISGIWSF
jgi:hypothetical protein